MIQNCTNGKNEIVWPRPPKKDTVKIKTLTLPAYTPKTLPYIYPQNFQPSRYYLCAVCKQPLTIQAIKDFTKIDMPLKLMRCTPCIVKNDPPLESLLNLLKKN